MGDDFVIGKKYRKPDGRTYMYRGGDPSERSSWRWIPTNEQMGTYAKGFARETAQGVTANWADEIEAKITGTPREQINAERDAYAESGGPVLVPQLAGAAATTGAASAKLASKIPQGIGWLRNALLMGTGAAGEGAIAGAGAAEPGQRGHGAKVGGAVGFGVGGVAFPALAGLGGVVKDAGISLLRPNVQREATLGLFEHLAKPGRSFDPGSMASQMRSGASAPDQNLADMMGRRAQLAGRRALADDPSNTDDIIRGLRARDAGSLDDVGRATREYTGLPPGHSRDEHIEALRKVRGDEAEKLFATADVAGDQLGVGSDPEVLRVLGEIAEYPDANKSLQAIRKTEGIAEGQPWTSQALRRLKRSITARVNPGFKPGGVPDDMLKALQDDLQGVLENKIPGYQAANARFSQRIEAEEVAQKLAPRWRSGGMDADNIRYHMGKMDPGARQEYVYAVAGDLEAQITDKMLKNPKTAFNFIENMKPRLRAVFGDDNAATYFNEIDRLRREFDTYTFADAGSLSADRAGLFREGGRLEKILTAVAYALNRMYGAAARTGIQSTLRSKPAQQAMSREVAKLLYQPARETLEQFSRISPFMQQAHQQVMGQRGLLSNIGGYVGGTGLLGNRQ